MSVLSRYLNPEMLTRLAGRRVEPRGLVMGTLAGAHRSPLHGFAVEFAGHREYVPGDDVRHVDWRVYFKRGKYFVKQYEMETNFVCHLVLDFSASMRFGEGPEQKLQYAAELATALGYAIIRQNDKVSLALVDQAVREFVPPGSTMAQLVRMLERLDAMQATDTTDLPHVLTELAGRFGRRQIVLVFSDFFGDLEKMEPALQRLRYSQHEVVLLQVMHHSELVFDLDDLTRFVGLEGQEALLAQPDDIRRGYLDALARHNGRLDEICQANRIERVLIDTRRDPAEVLVDYLNQRARTTRRIR